MCLKIPVIAYHAANIFGDQYSCNDNLALKSDLKAIEKNGIEVISLHRLVAYLQDNTELDENKKYIAISFDDGNNLDFIDSQYPDFGMQKSFYSRLKQANHYVHATSFVMASPKARKTMERTCLQGFPLLSEDWWQQAEASEVMSIENHSWDHVHPTLENVNQEGNIKGDFAQITTKVDADAQILKSSHYIDSKLINKKTSLFAYPFGHYNEFLTEVYFPKMQNTIKAAFTCEPNYVTKETNIWKIPRFVCGCDWKSEEQFIKLINLEYDDA